MKRFPEFVRNSMDYTGSSVTCLPVQFDGGDWESAVFFQVAGPESKEDRKLLARNEGTVPVSMETELISHQSASIILLRLEVYTREVNPLVGEVLLAPGEMKSHFETIKLLANQTVLRWFFSDAAYWIIHSQQNSLGAVEHGAFQEVLDEAVKHDSLIRVTGKYDAGNALNEVLSHYEFRSAQSGVATSAEQSH